MFRVAYLALIQRTNIQKQISNSTYLFFNKIFRGGIKNLYILKQSINHKKVLEKYYETVITEDNLLNEIVAKLPGKSISIIDIGCGIAGYHKNWLKNYKEKEIQLFLMDSSTFNLAALRYGHGEVNRYYNSLKLSKKLLLKSSGVKSELIQLIEIKSGFVEKLPKKLDLIISFISWGFHYPLDTYWDLMLARMTIESSVMLIDVRKNSNSSDFLFNQKNVTIEIINTTSKFDRVLIRKVSET